MNMWYCYAVIIAWIHGVFYSKFVVEKADTMSLAEVIFHSIIAGIILCLLTFVTYKKTRRK